MSVGVLTRTPVFRWVLQSGQWEGLPEQCADSVPSHLWVCQRPKCGCPSQHRAVPSPLRVYSQSVWRAQLAARYVDSVLATNYAIIQTTEIIVILWTNIITGDVIKIHDKQADGWWLGELNGVVGIFPATYVQEMDWQPSHSLTRVLCQGADAIEIRNLYHVITEVSLSLERLDLGQHWEVGDMCVVSV
jgi:hypothetical protein